MNVKNRLTIASLAVLTTCTIVGWVLWRQPSPVRGVQSVYSFEWGRFLVLAFPRDPTVEIRAKSDGRVLGQLDRPLILSLREIDEAKEEFSCFYGDTECLVKKSDVVFQPQQETEKMMQSLNRQIKMWGVESDWETAAVSIEPRSPSAKVGVMFRLKDKNSNQTVFVYSVSEDKITAIRIDSDR